jgi:UTP--glucose-1-phosphate uridylyltransferase
MLTLSQSQPFYGYEFGGETFDCGSKEGFVEANIAMALARADMKQGTLDMMRMRAGAFAANQPQRATA